MNKEVNKYSWEKIISLLLLTLGGGYVIWATYPIWQQQWLNDDSFITLTYAKNLVSGNGFVYNHPPATLGTTTPLFTILTALFAIILPGFSVIDTAIILSVVSWIGTGLVLYMMGNHLGLHPLASTAVAIVPLTIVNGTWLWFVGMEIWLFQFLLVLSFYLSLTNRPALAGMIVGLLFLTRGEGVLVGGILVGYYLLTERKLPKSFIVAGMAVFSIWAIYAFIIFSTILPNTLAAKIAQREFLINYGRDYSFIRVMLERLTEWLQSFNLGSTIFANIFLLAMILGLVAILSQKRFRYWAFFLIWAIAYFVAYTIINPSTYPWYALHLYFVGEVMAGVGLGWMVDTTFKLSDNKKLAIGIVTCLFVTFLLIPTLYRGIESAQSFWGDSRAPAYISIADWLNHNTQPEDSIAYLEIGYLGYYSQNRIIDLAGLTDPLIAANIAEHGFTWGFWHYQPKYFLFNPGMDNEAYLAGIRAAANQYREVARFPGGPDGVPLVLFERLEHTDTQ
ncbi:MAG: hypothetical protein JXM69_01630 [Anaerolineae bacterium]|nr:hypothetical protein [Anaerolineae bacterium]